MLFFCDAHTAISLTVMVFLATNEPLSSSKSGIGLSFWSSLCLSHAFDSLAFTFTHCETFLASSYKLQDIVERIPVEDHESGIDLPASWPDRGDVTFDGVTARYK